MPPASQSQPVQPTAWGAPPPQQPQSPPSGWGAPASPGQDPAWAPPPPPSPRTQATQQQPAWGAPAQPSPDTYGGWPGGPPPQQPPPGYAPPGYAASGYAASAYGGFAPAPARGGRLALILGGIAAAVVVVLVIGIVLVPRLLGGLNPGANVPPAMGATVSTAFVQLKTTSSWNEAQKDKTEVELTNSGDGDLLVGYGNSGQDEVSSDASAFSNLQGNLKERAGGQISQCVPEHSVTVGGKTGEEEGFQFTLQGTQLCLLAWVDYVSSTRYYFWNVLDDSSRLSALQRENAAMQETVSWKV